MAIVKLCKSFEIDLGWDDAFILRTILRHIDKPDTSFTAEERALAGRIYSQLEDLMELRA